MNTKRLGKIGGAWWLADLLSIGGFGTAHAHHVIVDTDYVLKNKDKPGVVWWDARGAADYKKGLIPGAAVLGEKARQVVLRDAIVRVPAGEQAREDSGRRGHHARERDHRVWGQG